jgi:predicted nucleic acid-binding Zn ribbon protein
MKDEPIKRCPECRCKVKRLLGTGSGIIFKGSGFYETDYRSESYASAKAKDSSSDKAGSSSTKADKPEKKKSAKKPSKT